MLKAMLFPTCGMAVGSSVAEAHHNPLLTRGSAEIPAYQAIKGLGGTARYVVLPGESHGYQARESVLDTLAEMIGWLDRRLAAGGVLEASAGNASASELGSAAGAAGRGGG